VLVEVALPCVDASVAAALAAPARITLVRARVESMSLVFIFLLLSSRFVSM
jgi:hypothetical protein